MTTLLDSLIPRAEQQQAEPERPEPKVKRRRWGRERRPSKTERLAAEQHLAAALRARRQVWAASLVPHQTELLGHAVTLPPGVEAVGQDQEGEGA